MTVDLPYSLVALAAAGDARAVSEVVRALQRPVFGVALRMLGDREDAQDATQEALIRIVTRLAQFRAESKFSTWAWRIAVRRILDFREQRAATARATFAGFAADLADGLDPAAPDRPEDAVLNAQLRQRCTAAMLHCLDGDHRIAFVLGEVLELPAPEAAAILEIDPAAFRKRLSRARAELAAFLDDHCGCVNPAAACACHRRLDRAIERGRLTRDPAANTAATEPRDFIAALREALQLPPEAP